MRLVFALPIAALALAASPARAQLYVTGVTATIPDPNGKVPAFNAVPGAGIATLSTGFAQAVLIHGNSYNYCVTLASADTNGKGQVSFSLKRGAAVILSDIIIKRSGYTVSPNGVWFYCSGYIGRARQPGCRDAHRLGIVCRQWCTTKHVSSHVSVPVVIQ